MDTDPCNHPLSQEKSTAHPRTNTAHRQALNTLCYPPFRMFTVCLCPYALPSSMAFSHRFCRLAQSFPTLLHHLQATLSATKPLIRRVCRVFSCQRVPRYAVYFAFTAAYSLPCTCSRLEFLTCPICYNNIIDISKMSITFELTYWTF